MTLPVFYRLTDGLSNDMMCADLFFKNPEWEDTVRDAKYRCHLRLQCCFVVSAWLRWVWNAEVSRHQCFVEVVRRRLERWRSLLGNNHPADGPIRTLLGDIYASGNSKRVWEKQGSDGIYALTKRIFKQRDSLSA